MNDPNRWFVKIKSEDTGPDEIRQLSETDLQRLLLRSGDRLDAISVKQGGSQWHSAHVVLKKFEQLGLEGIYLRREGAVEGPYTAIKTVEILEAMNLDQVHAKVGIHSDWVPAVRLLQRLQWVREGSDGKPLHEDEIQLPKIRDPNAPPRTAAPMRFPPGGQDPPTSCQADPIAGSERVEVESDVGDRFAENPSAEHPSREHPSAEPGAIELILVAEPVSVPPQPIIRQPQRVAAASKRRARKSHPAEPRPPELQPSKTAGHSGLWIAAAIVGLVMVTAAAAVGVIYGGYGDAITESSDPVAARAGELEGTREATSKAADGPAPVVGEGTLFRPSFDTSMGRADGGTLFAARVGRSNRMLLVGAAHLLGPATGLERQLRGAEVLMHLKRLAITDCVSSETVEVAGAPLRLRTAEYPSISVHGDSLVFEPLRQIGLDPLAVSSKLPSKGDRVWLLAPARGTKSLAHAGRWIGSEDDWLIYRLDNPTLDLVGTSGGAVVNVDHEVIGIQVASRQSDQGVTSIVSPIRSIIDQMR